MIISGGRHAASIIRMPSTSVVQVEMRFRRCSLCILAGVALSHRSLMMVADACNKCALTLDMIAAIGAARNRPAAHGGSTCTINVGIT
ncbi:hypothetical protein D3C76_1303240 [compost metagenome]